MSYEKINKKMLFDTTYILKINEEMVVLFFYAFVKYSHFNDIFLRILI